MNGVNRRDMKKMYLEVAKNYINYLDLDGFNELNDIDEDTESVENDMLIEVHHQIIADILRYINRNVFDSDVEKTLKWMKRELNEYTYESFNSVDFDSCNILAI